MPANTLDTALDRLAGLTLLGVKPTEDLSASEQPVFSHFAMMLELIPDLSRWSKEEKSAVRQIARAKAVTDELRYVEIVAAPLETPRWFEDDRLIAL